MLIFSQMVKMLDILGDYMDYRGHSYQRLDGTIAASARRIAIDHFNADFTTEQTLKLTVTTSTGSVVQVTQKRTLTNMTPGASKIAGGLIRGYTFTMEKPKIEKIK